jgi:hypothetical protein
MSNVTYSLMALFLAGVLVWQLVSGSGLGAWWYPRITRQDNPRSYWIVVVIQGAIFILFLVTGKTWHVR